MSLLKILLTLTVDNIAMAMRGAALFDSLEASTDERRFLDLSSRGTALNVEEETGFMLWTVNEDIVTFSR